MKTIYILWIRQLKRYIRSRSRVVGSLGKPLLFLVALGFGFGPIYSRAGGGNYIAFIAPGVIGMGIIFTAIFGGIELIWDRQFGFLTETLVAPVPRAGIIMGRTLGGATVACIQGILVFLLTLVAGFRPVSVGGFFGAVVFMFLIALLFTALGTAIASRMEDMTAFPVIINFVIMPLFFLSGSLFPLQGLPAGILWVAKFNPLTYGIDGIRGTLTGAYHFGFASDMLILVIGGAALLAVGTYLFSKIEI